jgi:hypothetical protein
MKFNIFINNLIENININNIPREIDLILDGGAFNGGYQLGTLIYLKQLEELNITKIKRISGTSIGSTLGLLYSLNKLHFAMDMSNKLWKCFREKLDISVFKEIVYEIIENMNKNDYKKLNNKLYITYFDNKRKKQIIKSKYKNNKQIAKYLIKSGFVPYIIDGNLTYNNCIDGFYPYIFKKRNDRKRLFIKLASISFIKSMYTIKSEKNAYVRILYGINDINCFFTNSKNTELCNYIDNWNIIDIISFKMRYILAIIWLYYYDFLKYIYQIIQQLISQLHSLDSCHQNDYQKDNIPHHDNDIFHLNNSFYNSKYNKSSYTNISSQNNSTFINSSNIIILLQKYIIIIKSIFNNIFYNIGNNMMRDIIHMNIC